jgi:hypothetical protein
LGPGLIGALFLSQLFERHKKEEHGPRLASGKSVRLYLKNQLKKKRAGGMAQAVEHFLFKKFEHFGKRD